MSDLEKHIGRLIVVEKNDSTIINGIYLIVGTNYNFGLKNFVLDRNWRDFGTSHCYLYFSSHNEFKFLDELKK